MRKNTLTETVAYHNAKKVNEKQYIAEIDHAYTIISGDNEKAFTVEYVKKSHMEMISNFNSQK